jgi:threonine synthase
VRAGKVLAAETVVLVLTGHMLKDSDYTIDFHRGQLLTAEETEGWEKELELRRRGTRSLDANAEAVLRELEAAVPA